MSRAPFVAMLTDLRKEERVRFAADYCGYNEDEAIGKFFRLWSWCVDRGLDDAPDDCDGYAVAEPVVRRFLGPRGVEGILGDGCDDLAMGVRRYDGLIYLRGTSETVGRLRGLRTSAVAGGRSRASSAVRNGGGKFASVATLDQPANQLTNQPQPAVSSEIPPPTSHLPDPQISLPRAIPPSTEHGQKVAAPPEAGSETGKNLPVGDRPSPPPVPQPGKSAWHRRSAWWALMLEADARVRAAGIEPNAPTMPKSCAGENERNLNACEKQLLEGGDDADTVDRKLRHLIAYRERECIRDRTRRWLSPAALWDPKRANYAFDRPLDEADKSPLARAGPRSSAGRAEPQQTIRPKHTDDAPPIPSWSKA